MLSGYEELEIAIPRRRPLLETLKPSQAAAVRTKFASMLRLQTYLRSVAVQV